MSEYTIKEIYYTLQGEGAQTGRPAVFCRFAGCNLWSGKKEDRQRAICSFCDTDFIGTDGENGGRYPTAEALAQKVTSLWPDISKGNPYVVCTGGEPLLQLDKEAIDAFHRNGFEVGIETNGTINAPENVDWICVSPKANTDIKITKGDELKLVFLQNGAIPSQFEQLDFTHFFLQPMDGPYLEINTKLALKYCLKHPLWRLSMQMHKVLGIS
ncbi:MAG: 7-carboxy-7-deazaguanine synthase [Bacteroidetes bacterium]|nr:7-carboxy-7-deazaguanine synthase [Bacteroidota bacterium]